MRIIGKEFRKILDIRILLILAVFTGLFFWTFLQVFFPKNGNIEILGGWANYPYAIELMKEFGTTIQISDWSKIEDKKSEMKNEYDKVISANEKCRETGITTYDEMMEYEDKYINTYIETDGELPEEEKALHDEIMDIMHEQLPELTSKMEYLNELDIGGETIGMSQEEAGKAAADWGIKSERIKEEFKDRFTRNYTTFIPFYVFDVLWEDMPRLGILLLVSFFSLVLFYQVKERLRGTINLCVTTHTGRKLFGKQFLACMLSCAIIGGIQLLAYFGALLRKGFGPLLTCKCQPFNGPFLWCDNISYGMFFLIYAVIILLFALLSVAIAYLIGRVAANYIVGIAISIPTVIGIALLLFNLFKEFLQINPDIDLPYWELLCTALWSVIMVAAVMWRLRKDRTIDLA